VYKIISHLFLFFGQITEKMQTFTV